MDNFIVGWAIDRRSGRRNSQTNLEHDLLEPIDQNQRRLTLAEEKYNSKGEPYIDKEVKLDDFNEQFENKQIVAEGNMIDYQSMFHELPGPSGGNSQDGAGQRQEAEVVRQP